jgi:L-threonylcarbamoyladenylate synthase
MESEIQKALEVLHGGGILLYPTDTVWGLGCDATNADAVSRIFKIKKRVSSKSLIVLLSGVNQLELYVQDVPEAARGFISNSTKPLSIIYNKGIGLAPLVMAEDGSVCIRITKDKFCQQLINKFGKPIVSSSANVSSEKTPANFSEITAEIKSQVDYVVRWRQNEPGKAQASRIIQLSSESEGGFKVIRE